MYECACIRVLFGIVCFLVIYKCFETFPGDPVAISERPVNLDLGLKQVVREGFGLLMGNRFWGHVFGEVSLADKVRGDVQEGRLEALQVVVLDAPLALDSFAEREPAAPEGLGFATGSLLGLWGLGRVLCFHHVRRELAVVAALGLVFVVGSLLGVNG